MAGTPEFAPRALQTLSGLRFSTATSAFQIEGARTLDGRGRSIWDEFVDEPGNVIDSSTADPGPDSYHRSAEDAALLAGLGVDRSPTQPAWTIPIASSTSFWVSESHRNPLSIIGTCPLHLKQRAAG